MRYLMPISMMYRATSQLQKGLAIEVITHQLVFKWRWRLIPVHREEVTSL